MRSMLDVSYDKELLLLSQTARPCELHAAALSRDRWRPVAEIGWTPCPMRK